MVSQKTLNRRFLPTTACITTFPLWAAPFPNVYILRRNAARTDCPCFMLTPRTPGARSRG
jgi:hypothetical protein